MKDTKRQMHEFFPSSPFYNFELTRILGTTPSGGCDVGSFLEAVGSLQLHVPWSWYCAWMEQAERASSQAADARRKGLLPLARQAYLRAANFYRAAPYMMPQTEERALYCAQRSVGNFEQAVECMEGRVLSFEFALEGTSFPARLFLPADSKRLTGRRTPVVINCGGADSTSEELYLIFGELGTSLGYALVTFDGPGQGLALKRDGIPTRPDYEVIISAVLDSLHALNADRHDLHLDLDHVCLVGISMGGYSALRGAAAECKKSSEQGVASRVAACVAADPLYDMWDLAMTRMPGWLVRLWLQGWISDAFINWACRKHMELDFPSKWEFTLSMNLLGQSSPADLLREFKRYSLRGSGLMPHVTCPVMLTGAPFSVYQTPEVSTLRIERELTGVAEKDKYLWIPESVGEGGLTGKVGAWTCLGQETFSFLDKVFEIQRRIPI